MQSVSTCVQVISLLAAASLFACEIRHAAGEKDNGMKRSWTGEKVKFGAFFVHLCCGELIL